MRTFALIKVNSIRGALLGVILLLALMMFFVIGARPSHAASLEGDYTLDNNFTNVTSLPDTLQPTQFELYKVGSFISDAPYVKLDSPYDSMDIALPLDVDKEKAGVVAWTKDWLQCANTLKNSIPEETEPVKTFSSVKGADGKWGFSVTGLDNGLYLLTGEGQQIENYPTPGQSAYWWPQPMLVSILDSDAKVSVKPMYGEAPHLKVRKDWQGIPQDLKDIVQPKSIDVEIYYDGELKYPNDDVKEVKLSDENDWSFEWDADKSEADPSKWTVKEVIDENAKQEFDKNFSITIGTNFVKDKDGVEVITITNKYDRYELEIQKTFEAYIENGEGNSTSIVFELSGYADEQKSDRVYHKFVGLQMDKSKGGEQTLNVKDIPRGLKHLMVKEVYSGNFKPDKAEKEAVLQPAKDDAKGIYSVSFDNSPDNTTHGSGVINKYKINKKAFELDKRLGAGD